MVWITLMWIYSRLFTVNFILMRVVSTQMFSFMDYLEFLFLLLEQGEHSHENHTKDFVDFTKETHYPDDCLITFYRVVLNTSTQAQ